MRGWLCAALLLITSPAAAAPPACVAIRLPARQTLSNPGKPVRLTVWVTVEQHDDHRRLTVVALDGEFPVQTHEEDLAGAKARRTQLPIVWDLGIGDYQILAEVTLANGQKRRTYTPFRVLGESF